MQRVILYARVSKGDDQDPESQLQALRTWATGRGWLVVAEKIDRVTGDPKRRKTMPPHLAAALQLLRAQKADVLAVWALDRVVRSGKDLLNFLHEVVSAGGVFESMRNPELAQLSGPFRDLVIVVHGLIAELELELIRDRTKAGLRRVQGEGQILGRPSLHVDLALARHLYSELGSLRAVGKAMECSSTTLFRLFQKGSTKMGLESVELKA
jgi:DNA invertase Pin-like site-specific DNA recombinase